MNPSPPRSEFLLLFRGTDGRSLRHAPEAYQAHLQRLGDWIAQLEPHGKIIAADPLTSQPTILQNRRILTDHPLIEAKEMVGGYMRFQHDSYDSALRWAQACPIFEFEDGMVELREIESLDL